MWFEAEMRNQVLARQLQTKPLRGPVLGLRDECYGSCGVEQDDIASSEIYDSVVLNDCRSAGKLNYGVIILHVITANIRFRTLNASRVAGEIRCDESEDAPRAHLAGEDVGFESGTKQSPILAQRSSETVIVQFWRAEKIVVWVHHQLHGTTMLQT
ncbi:hypothetical protein MA20_31120 [Bradyrhizobium japonicum]|uniref:Uncharacterized protein n=1 Tax=Bradyrhizobium japonicum TaxID=375 RepID=A0A0A3XMR3_BRAJP|nr:hypothetical protein MA20_31120 [Bradyrhizobium japonicum]